MKGYSDHAQALTPRMRDVLLAAASGQRIAQTACELGVSEETVRTVRTAACRRLDAPNVTAAAVRAVRSGLI